MNDIARPQGWYQDAVIYELHVRAFQDGNGDGIGDFVGLISRLDYLQELGVTALWLLPFYPSPLRDDGYDIADYTRVNPIYGDLDDFRRFLDAAHARGLHVITELVINHTSDQHAWFQRARKAPPGSPERAFYVWSDDDAPYRDARIIFQDFETSNWAWDPVANAYYWHRFYSHQPDLNFDNPAVHDALFEVLDFWLGMGVDGLRLDAVPYLYEREGTNCENLPETHAFLRKLRAHVDERFPGRMLLAEANQWPEDAASYFGAGDECHMNFHFPLMPRMYMAVAQEDRFSLVDILAQTPPLPEGCQWATFLRNHDELTLEMVTDEERDAMLRAYAAQPRARVNLGIRRRLAPLMQNHRARIELMLGLLLSLPGTPVLYYGDELGMGDNIFLGDRDAVRTPMQWSADRNAGFSAANPQQLFLPLVIDPEYHFSGVNVEIQQANPSSLLWHTRRLLGLRGRHPALGRGDLTFLEPDNRKILAFIRATPDDADGAVVGERILVVANLARSPQSAELDLSAFAGFTPTELSGPTAFPPIGDLPYHLTLGPYGLYWFRLDAADRAPTWALERDAPPPRLTVDAFDWSDLTGRLSTPWGDALRRFVERQRWFVGGDVRGLTVTDLVPLGDDARLAVLTVRTDDAELSWVVPLALATGEAADAVRAQRPPTVATIQRAGASDAILYDPTGQPGFVARLLSFIAGGETRHSERGRLVARPNGALDASASDPVHIVQRDAPATRVVSGHAHELVVFHVVGAGGGPADELWRVATEAGLDLVPPYRGALDWAPADAQATAPIVVVHAHVPGRTNGSAWARDEALRFFETELAEAGFAGRAGLPRQVEPRTDRVAHLRGTLDALQGLGRALASFHLTLAAHDAEGFRPTPFSQLYQRSLYQGFRTTARRALAALERHRDALPAASAARADAVIASEEHLLDTLDDVIGDKLDAARARVHGSLTLSRLRWTGHGFVLTDLAASLSAPASEQRLLRSPLVDVASLIASVEANAHRTSAELAERGLDQVTDLHGVRRFWVSSLTGALVSAYRRTLADADADRPTLVPADDKAFEVLLRAFVLRRLLGTLDDALAEPEPDLARIGALLEAIDERSP